MQPSEADSGHWEPPSEFDQIRELNAHGGRLATLYGLILTAYTISAASEPVRQLLVSIYVVNVNSQSALVLIDAVIGVGSLVLGFASALATMHPPIPRAPQHDDYVNLRTSKAAAAAFSGLLVLVCLFALLAVWSAAVAIPTGDPRLDALSLWLALLFTVASVLGLCVVLVRHRGLVRQLAR